VERLFRFDKDGDGKASKEELPEFLRGRILERMDANQDGVIEKKEAERIFGAPDEN
jgi:Ca2+-binding EF-hand superfamily protein